MDHFTPNDYFVLLSRCSGPKLRRLLELRPDLLPTLNRDVNIDALVTRLTYPVIDQVRETEMELHKLQTQQHGRCFRDVWVRRDAVDIVSTMCIFTTIDWPAIIRKWHSNEGLTGFEAMFEKMWQSLLCLDTDSTSIIPMNLDAVRIRTENKQQTNKSIEIWILLSSSRVEQAFIYLFFSFRKSSGERTD
jgi:hypothetical protein